MKNGVPRVTRLFSF